MPTLGWDLVQAKSEDPRKRKKAVAALSKSAARPAVEILARLRLYDPEKELRDAASAGLAALGGPAVESLLLIIDAAEEEFDKSNHWSAIEMVLMEQPELLSRKANLAPAAITRIAAYLAEELVSVYGSSIQEDRRSKIVRLIQESSNAAALTPFLNRVLDQSHTQGYPKDCNSTVGAKLVLCEAICNIMGADPAAIGDGDLKRLADLRLQKQAYHEVDRGDFAEHVFDGYVEVPEPGVVAVARQMLVQRTGSRGSQV